MKPTRRQMEQRVVRAAMRWFRNPDMQFYFDPDNITALRPEVRQLFNACARLSSRRGSK